MNEGSKTTESHMQAFKEFLWHRINESAVFTSGWNVIELLLVWDGASPSIAFGRTEFSDFTSLIFVLKQQLQLLD